MLIGQWPSIDLQRWRDCSFEWKVGLQLILVSEIGLFIGWGEYIILSRGSVT